MLGHDFLPFYTAGTFARTGHADQLYNLHAVRRFEQQVAAKNSLELGPSFGPFWNPPFYAWVFAPLSQMPYRSALLVWTGINLAALLIAITLLIHMLPPQVGWRSWLLVPALIAVSMPFVQAISHAQNTFISLMLVAAVVTAWRARWDVTAGILCGLLFYKPQLAAVVAAVLVISRGMRVCLGLSFTLGVLVLTTAVSMPDAIGDYLHRLPQNLHFMQIQNDYLWERHVTIKAFWRLLIQGRGAGEPLLIVQALTIACAAAVGITLLMAARNSRLQQADDCWSGENRALRRDRLVAATITAMPLLMPFYFDYDLLLLAIPAVLFAGEVLARPVGALLTRDDTRLLRAWAALFLWLLINPGVARMSGVNVSVILLATVAAMQAVRALRSQPDADWGREAPEVIKVSARRAA